MASNDYFSEYRTSGTTRQDTAYMDSGKQLTVYSSDGAPKQDIAQTSSGRQLIDCSDSNIQLGGDNEDNILASKSGLRKYLDLIKMTDYLDTLVEHGFSCLQVLQYASVPDLERLGILKGHAIIIVRARKQAIKILQKSRQVTKRNDKRQVDPFVEKGKNGVRKYSEKTISAWKKVGAIASDETSNPPTFYIEYSEKITQSYSGGHGQASGRTVQHKTKKQKCSWCDKCAQYIEYATNGEWKEHTRSCRGVRIGHRKPRLIEAGTAASRRNTVDSDRLKIEVETTDEEGEEDKKDKKEKGKKEGGKKEDGKKESGRKEKGKKDMSKKEKDKKDMGKTEKDKKANAQTRERERKKLDAMKAAVVADQKAWEEEREDIEQQQKEKEAKLKANFEKERERLKEKLARQNEKQSKELERLLAEEREAQRKHLAMLKKEANKLAEENRKRIEAEKQAALLQAEEMRKKYEQERQKLEATVRDRKKEAEEFEKSRLQAEEQRKKAQQAEKQRIENKMREREHAATEAAKRQEAEAQRVKDAKAEAKAARQEQKKADAARRDALATKKAKREHDAKANAKNTPRVVNSEMSNEEFAAHEERLEKESNKTELAYEEVENSLKEQLEDALEHIDELVEQRIQLQRMKSKVDFQRIHANCQEKLLNFEDYVQELNVGKLVLDNERIFANESQNLALDKQSKQIEEDLRAAKQSNRKLESDADFLVDKEKKQVERWEKRFQKKAQRRRQKTTRDLEQQMETNAERFKEMTKGFEKARQRNGDSYALDNARVQWRLWHEEITEQCDEFQKRSSDRSKAKRSKMKQELADMKKQIADFKERAERCARERITRENKYHEKVAELAEEHKKRVLQKKKEKEEHERRILQEKKEKEEREKRALQKKKEEEAKRLEEKKEQADAKQSKKKKGEPSKEDKKDEESQKKKVSKKKKEKGAKPRKGKKGEDEQSDEEESDEEESDEEESDGEEEQETKEDDSDEAKLRRLTKLRVKVKVNLIKLSSSLEILRLKKKKTEKSVESIKRAQEKIAVHSKKMADIDNEINKINARIAGTKHVATPAVVAAAPPPGASVVSAASAPPPPPPPVLTPPPLPPTLPRIKKPATPAALAPSAALAPKDTTASTPSGGDGGLLDALKRGFTLRKTIPREKKPKSEDPSLFGVALALKVALDKRRNDMALRQREVVIGAGGGGGDRNADSDSDSDWE